MTEAVKLNFSILILLLSPPALAGSVFSQFTGRFQVDRTHCTSFLNAEEEVEIRLTASAGGARSQLVVLPLSFDGESADDALFTIELAGGSRSSGQTTSTWRTSVENNSLVALQDSRCVGSCPDSPAQTESKLVLRHTETSTGLVMTLTSWSSSGPALSSTCRLLRR